jgi:hypothetical protein
VALPSKDYCGLSMTAGETVFHILGPNHVEGARITDGAKLGAAGSLTYPLTDHPDQTKKVHIIAN